MRRSEEAEISNRSRGAERDWAALHERLASAREKLNRSMEPSRDEIRRILHERALRIAGERASRAPETPKIEVLRFMVAHENYAVESRFVREVQVLRDYACVPGAPDHVVGVVGFRGEMLTIVSLKRLFDIRDQSLMERDRLIVLEGERRCAILANGIDGVMRVDEAAFGTPPATLTGIRADFSKGVAADGLTLLDADAILESRKIGLFRRTSPSRSQPD